MSKPRTVLTAALMVFGAGFVVAMLGLLWLVGQDLAQLKKGRSDLTEQLKRVEEGTKEVGKLREELQQANGERAKLAAAVEAATKEAAALRGDLAAIEARLKAVEEAGRPKLGVGLTPFKPPDAPPVPAPAAEPADAKANVDFWLERAKANPAHVAIAARRAFFWKGAAGLGYVVGLDDAGQAKLQNAYDEFLPKVAAAEKAHAKVTLDGETVRLDIAAYPEEGEALRNEWGKIVAGILTPEQTGLYKRGAMETVLFERRLGDYEQAVTLVKEGMGVKYDIRGRRRVGLGTGTFQSSSTVSGDGAVNRLPWRHLLTDEAIAKLRGVAQP